MPYIREEPTVVFLLGATGVGKTDLSLRLAQRLRASIVSADSRQIYKEIPIGTAAPSAEELAAVPHYLVGTHSVCQAYSASAYEQDALAIIDALHRESPYVVVVGGAMMYLDALAHGIDEIPDVAPEVRAKVYERFAQEGLEPLLAELRVLDPDYYARVDRHNYKRVLHGLEVCLSSGQPFSSFHTGRRQVRPFRIVKIGLRRERVDLYERINRRVLSMVDMGLEAEARAVLAYRHLNALNTVGYKEMFAHFDGVISLDEAIGQIQRNSRQYARKQLTWWQRDTEIVWFSPDDLEGIVSHIHRR